MNVPIEKTFQFQLKEIFKEIAQTHDVEEGNPYDTVVLYHGTNTLYLNDILEKGLRPSNELGFHQWNSDAIKPNDHMIYLTDKWHHFYAYNAVDKHFTDLYGESFADNPNGRWFHNLSVLPVYLEIVVPTRFLTIDEDIAYSPIAAEIFNDIQKDDANQMAEIRVPDLTWKDSLKINGTCVFKGTIPKEFIKKAVIFPSPIMYLDMRENKNSYTDDVNQWMNSKGKGALTTKDIKKIEKNYELIELKTKKYGQETFIDFIGFDSQQNKFVLHEKSVHERKSEPCFIDKGIIHPEINTQDVQRYFNRIYTKK